MDIRQRLAAVAGCLTGGPCLSLGDFVVLCRDALEEIDRQQRCAAQALRNLDRAKAELSGIDTSRWI